MSPVAPLFALLRDKGGARYGGEAVTQLQHALQCAALAERAEAGEAQAIAALLHDIGHLQVEDEGLAARGKDARHEAVGAALLRQVFGPSVTQPIRLHVNAKRYLTATDPAYLAGLSPASVTSLGVQGGPFSASEAEAFARRPYALEAVDLRRWDDLAKDPDARPPGLDHFAAAAERLSDSWRRGRLILVVGPSGAGKDSLLAAAKERLGPDSGFHFPRRSITRPSDALREDHESLTPEAFEARRAADGFCLSWQAHGLSYGIPAEALTWLERGEAVVVNVSRTLVQAATRRFPRVEVIHVTADPATIARRLADRDGAAAADSDGRLARSVDWTASGARVTEIANDGTLEQGQSAFLAALAA